MTSCALLFFIILLDALLFFHYYSYNALFSNQENWLQILNLTELELNRVDIRVGLTGALYYMDGSPQAVRQLRNLVSQVFYGTQTAKNEVCHFFFLHCHAFPCTYGFYLTRLPMLFEALIFDMPSSLWHEDKLSIREVYKIYNCMLGFR